MNWRHDVPGTEIRVGDVYPIWPSCDTATVVSITNGQLPEGAHYADVTLSNGMVNRCWQGFNYSVMRD